MGQDWSSSFTVDVISQIKEFCVQCDTREDYIGLRSMFDETKIRISDEWRPGSPCVRIENGAIVGRWPKEFYESGRYANLPKFTFDSSLPDFHITDISAVSLFG